MQPFLFLYGIISIGDKMNEKYYEQIIEQYSDMVYRLALSRTRNKENAEDVYQEVFYRLARKRPVFESEEHAKAWLIKVTINCTKNFWSKNKDLEELKEEIKFETPERGIVYYAVMELPIKYRTIIYLFYYEKYKISEIGKLLNMKDGTVKSRFITSKRAIKRKITRR